MLKHSLPRRTRAALVSTAAIAALLASPVTASAEPRSAHAAIETADSDIQDSGIQDSSTQTDELLASCPIDGAATFEDSWGWPRSGGRSHEGVDMIAERGTPVVAVGSGDAVFKQNRLGGNAVWLTAPNGDKFYYAHLDSFAGESRSVEAGDVIGFVGSSGNAQGSHLHFETLPGGNVENPYPHTLAACVPTPEEFAANAEYEANALNDPDVWERFVPTS
ncbi:MAG: M23 family metallopeptidase [Ilumatobacter sp.]|uniref:M23 family metallopeptidase n=1 Tax=Ilumatobacter sp. TaxID=1967498 RepID=UPI003C7307EC